VRITSNNAAGSTKKMKINLCKLLKEALSSMEAKIGADAYIVAWYLGRCLGEKFAEKLKSEKTFNIEDALKTLPYLSKIRLFRFSLISSDEGIKIKAFRATNSMEEALAKGILEGYFKTLLNCKVVAKKERTRSKSYAVFTLVLQHA